MEPKRAGEVEEMWIFDCDGIEKLANRDSKIIGTTVRALW